MTSKSLFFKLMKEEAKRRLWMLALAFLIFFFSFPVKIAMGMGSHAWGWYSEDALTRWKLFLETVSSWVGVGNVWTGILMTGAAVVCGEAGFCYLFSKKKADFYHSIPVSRPMLFGVNFLSGVWIVGVPYLVNLLLSVIVVALNGKGALGILMTALPAYVFHMCFFLLVYAVVLIAVMMTGNLIVSLLGSMVFFFYGPLMSLLIRGYFSEFFRTYSYGYGGYGERFLSPITYYWSYLLNRDLGIEAVWGCIGAVVAAAVASAAALWLYRKRPLESAGSAMAFQWLMGPIKMALVFFCGLSGYMLLWGTQGSGIWAIFGFVCGIFISNSLIEIIYHSDFRQLFAHWKQFAIAAAACVVVIGGIRLDVFGYDRYLPSAQSVDSASIYSYSMDEWMNYGYRDSKGNSYNGPVYAFQNMKVTDVEQVLKIAQAGIDRNHEITEQVSREAVKTSGSNEENYLSFYIQYHLKSGRRVTRVYNVPYSSIEQEITAIYREPEYKEGVFPIMIQQLEDTGTIYFRDETNSGEIWSRGWGEDEDTARQLLTAYQKDLMTLTLEERQVETPIAELKFTTRKEESEESDALRRYGYVRSNSSEQGYYPIYPSFENTINVLKSMNISVGKAFEGKEIKEIYARIRNSSSDREFGSDYYKLNKDGSIEHTALTDPDEIAAVLEALVPPQYVDYNWLCEINRKVEVLVPVDQGAGSNLKEYYLIQNKIPDFLKEMFPDLNPDSANEG